MCGITGFHGAGNHDDLIRMTRGLIHRGPDDQHTWHDTETALYLGFRRLAILDKAGGRQPMWTHDERFCIVFNGEIYNHLELRHDLEQAGHVFHSDHSDTETLLVGYRQWGAAVQERLNGMWAFVIYDRERRELFCSRDRFGQKPFFYTLTHNLFAFSSELKPLTMHDAITGRVSEMALQKYFAYGFIPAPHTLYREIHKLPGGHCLTYRLKDRSLKLSRWWSFKLEPVEREESLDTWGEQLRELIDRAVRRRLLSDVPLGVFLSGGIDSSSIACFAAGARSELETFAIGFKEPDFDESTYAARAAEHLKTRHHVRFLSLAETRERLPEVVTRLDEPMGDPSLLPTHLLCGFARERVTVALGGDGADELFAGYDPFLALKRASWYQRLVPRPLHQAIRLLMTRLPVSHTNISLDFKIKRALRGLSHPPERWLPVWMGPLAHEDIETLFATTIDPEELYAEAIQAWDETGSGTLVDRVLQFFTRLYLQDDILVKIDRAGMMHGLEVRAPFLDIELVDFVRRLPHTVKLRGATTKFLLKHAMATCLPDQITGRRKKGFGLPIGRWFAEGGLQPVKGWDAVMPPLAHAFVAGALADHQAGRLDQRQFLWNQLLLSDYL